MIQNNYTLGGSPISQGVPPKKEPDTPKVETHIEFIISKKDGKLWIKHETRIVDWKPILYYEKGIQNAVQRKQK